MEETQSGIQLLANYDDWKGVRKISITPTTPPKTIMEFLASLNMSLDDKVGKNLAKIVDLKKLDEAIASVQKGKKAEEVAELLAEINSRKIAKVINEMTEGLTGFQKNEIGELKDFCKVYAMKKALKEAGLILDYSQVAIPGMGRLKKTKV